MAGLHKCNASLTCDCNRSYFDGDLVTRARVSVWRGWLVCIGILVVVFIMI